MDNEGKEVGIPQSHQEYAGSPKRGLLQKFEQMMAPIVCWQPSRQRQNQALLIASMPHQGHKQKGIEIQLQIPCLQ